MNNKYRINTFHKTKEFLLCVNSSGTALQTMDIHHRLAYGPSFIETWNLYDHANVVQEIWNNINLYETTRGVNRYQALLIMLQRISGVFLPESSFDSLEQWIHTSNDISIGNLAHEVEQHLDPLLQKTLQWSRLIDAKIKTIDFGDKPPFKFVKETLEKASKYCDIAIISGASQEGLIEEWKRHNLLPFVDVIGSQDEGSKSECVSRLHHKGYDAGKVIMIGDAMADFEAAHDNGVSFYPIIIHDEDASWSMFKDYYLDKIVHKDFHQYQDALINMFCSNFETKILELNRT